MIIIDNYSKDTFNDIIQPNTGVGCKNLNRNFIGIELNDEYFKIAVDRINNTVVCLESNEFKDAAHKNKKIILNIINFIYSIS